MPCCSIVQCGAKKNPNQPHLTMHRFPKKEVLRQKWFEVIGMENIKPGIKVPRVCSLHFAESSFNKTLDVIRLRDDAVPSIHLVPSKKTLEPVPHEIKNVKKQALSMMTQPTLPVKHLNQITKEIEPELNTSENVMLSTSRSLMEVDNEAEIKVCRVCLSLDVKMFDMKDFKLTEMFHNVTGISVCDEKESIIHRVCWECAARLTAAAAFRHKAQLSDALLKHMAYMNRNAIAQLKYIYRDSLNSALTIQTVLTDECGDTSPDYKEIESLTDETNSEDDEPMKTNVGSDPLAGNNSNIEIKHMKSEIFSALTDAIENSEVYYNNKDKVLSEDDDVMTNATINDDCYVVIVVGDDENSPKLDVVGDTANESLSEEDTQSLEAASTNIAKKMMIREVGASCEQGNRLNDVEKQKIIASKEKGLSVAEVCEGSGKSNPSASTCNDDIKKRDKNDDGLNGPGFNDPGFDNEIIADTEVLNDKDDRSEEDYVWSDKENHSSDDSLPLEKCKEKAVKTMKKVKDPTELKIHRQGKLPSNDDLNFTLTQLTFEEQIAEVVKRQESSNYKNSFFKCSVCFKGFLDESAYNTHMLRHTDQFGEYECKICKMHYKQRHALKNHMVVHTQRYSCNMCSYVTKTRHTARRHEHWHKGTKYRCPHCPEEFNHISTYLGHLRIKHPSDFVCEICGYSFVNAKGRELHKKLKHPLENVQILEDGPLCELCNVRFVSSEAHKRHLSVSPKHNTDKDSREPNQPKKDLTRRVLVKGKWRRIYGKPLSKADLIPCEQCGVELEDSRAYFVHFRRMHPDKNRTKYPAMKAPCMCEVCGKMVQSQFHLTEHVCVHLRERTFTCESCGKAYRTKPRLVAHQRLHSQEPPSYECTVCGKQFSNYSNRQRHMAIHTGLKPYKCEICGKGFKLPAEKRIHVTYVHLKKPWPKRIRGKRKSETGQVKTKSNFKS